MMAMIVGQMTAMVKPITIFITMLCSKDFPCHGRWLDEDLYIL
jgi:hypothetical protein